MGRARPVRPFATTLAAVLAIATLARPRSAARLARLFPVAAMPSAIAIHSTL